MARKRRLMCWYCTHQWVTWEGIEDTGFTEPFLIGCKHTGSRAGRPTACEFSGFTDMPCNDFSEAAPRILTRCVETSHETD